MASASSTEIEIGRYLIETDESKALFKGNYDVLVCLGKHVFTETTVVAKRYQVFKQFPEEMLRSIEQEACLMKAIPPHENIVQIFDFLKTDGLSTDGEDVFHLWLVMEYCQLGDLRKFARATPLSFSQKLDLMIQSAKGVQHLHLNNKVHRDIKPPNLLVTGKASKPIIKVADFGESKHVVGTLHTSRGTDPFKAPEILLDSAPSYDNSIDIFSLGCTYLPLVDYKKPGQSMIPIVEGQFVARYVRNHPGEDLAAHIITEEDSTEEAELKRFLALMMSNDPSARPSIQQVIDTLSHLLAASDCVALPEHTPKSKTVHSTKPSAVHSTCPEKEAQPSSLLPDKPYLGSSTKTPHSGVVRQKESHTAVREADKGKSSSDASEIKTINWQKAKITLAGSTAMSEKISWLVSFGSCGEVLVNDASHLSLYRHKATTSSSSSSSSTAASSSSSLILDEKILLPKGSEPHVYKAVAGDALYVQNLTDDAPTHQLSITKPHQQNTLHHSGSLLGAIDEALVYAVQRSDDDYHDYIIQIHRASGEVILKPPSANKWDFGLSVCCTDRFYTVVEHMNECLDVFTHNGEHVKHMDLGYYPRHYSGISSCNHSHVMVADAYSQVLYVYQIPGGDRVRSISGEELGLREDDWVRGVNYSNNGWITVAVGEMYSHFLHSLRTYKVSSE